MCLACQFVCVCVCVCVEGGGGGDSLGTRPLKIKKEGLVNWLGWKCTLRPVCRGTSDWLLITEHSDVRLLEMLTA